MVKLPGRRTTARCSSIQSVTTDPRQGISLSFVEVEYSRPSARNRAVFGDLVSYDKVWRTGANQSTKITFGEGILLEGNRIPPGKYALYTIPGKTEWTIILSKNVTWWGAYEYTNAEDALRLKVRPESLPSPLETLTIAFDNANQNSAIMTIAWEGHALLSALRQTMMRK